MADKRTPDTLKRATKPIFELFTKKKTTIWHQCVNFTFKHIFAILLHLKNRWIVSTGDISLKLLTETKRFGIK